MGFGSVVERVKSAFNRYIKNYQKVMLLAKRIFSRLRDPKITQYENMASDLVNQTLEKRIQGFYYLSLKKHISPEHYKQF